MPLTVRFVIAFLLVAVLATGLAGYGVRTATRETMERDFADRIEAASTEVHAAVVAEAKQLTELTPQKIAPMLDRVGKAHGVALAVLDPKTPEPSGDFVRKTIKLDEVAGLTITATVPRDSLTKALAKLDREILQNGGVASLVALLFAIVLARSLASPINDLARETREIVSGEPRPVRRRGSPEICELSDSFNKAIEELTRIRKRLAATERIAARREIARQVAHEIKNPLAPIRAAVETLRRLHGRGDDAFEEYFDEATKTVLEEVHRIANIVGEFTKFSRLAAPNPEPMDLVAVAKGVVALHAIDPDDVRTGGARHRVELIVEAETPEIRADRDQMVQVLTNLVQNGLDAATAIRPDPRVTVTIGPTSATHVRIVVRDNGPGVAEEMRDKLFEPYATSKSHGTGLGLAICQRIVFEHGGEISYRPATKGGAVFEIVLPIAGPSLLERSMEISSQPVSRFDDRRLAADAASKAAQKS